MESLVNVALFTTGIAALFLGGEGLVGGASRLARMLGIKPIVIGLTIVAFGTSAPEFVVCLIAAFKGSSDIVLGNIVGSNISNIGLILGLSAIICSISIQLRLVKLEVPVMILLSLALYAVSWQLGIGRLAGALLFLFLVIFTIYTYFAAGRESPEVMKEYEEFLQNGRNSLWKQLAYIILGLGGLVLGAHLVVDSAIFFARMFGVSELIISISAVAIGTSLPELSTSVVAAYRKEPDIIVGNIIGSNIFNIGILGLVSLIHPIVVSPGLLRFEFPVMIFFSIIILPVMATGLRVRRSEGIALLVLYSVFIYMVFARS